MIIVFFCLPALPLQTDSQSIQNGDKCLGKDSPPSDDSAVMDLSPKTDSSPKTDTPTKTDESSKTDVKPSTPGNNSSPQPKKGAVMVVTPFTLNLSAGVKEWLMIQFIPQVLDEVLVGALYSSSTLNWEKKASIGFGTVSLSPKLLPSMPLKSTYF